MNQTVIDIQGITKTYVNGKLSVPVLHGIDLVVNKGEFVSIMGPSGSGKSTFMNILGCLDRPTTGSYRLNGDEVATLSDDELAYVRNKQIGFVFQSFNLLTKLTALENVALPMIYAGVNKRCALNGPLNYYSLSAWASVWTICHPSCLVGNVNVWRLLVHWQIILLLSWLMNRQGILTQVNH